MSLSAVSEIVKGFECIRRDHANGDILTGGTSVSVAYLPEIVAPVAEAAAAVLESAPEGVQVDLGGGIKATRFGGMREEVRAHGPGLRAIGLLCFGTRYAAQQIAVAYIDAQAASAKVAA